MDCFIEPWSFGGEPSRGCCKDKGPQTVGLRAFAIGDQGSEWNVVVEIAGRSAAAAEAAALVA